MGQQLLGSIGTELSDLPSRSFIEFDLGGIDFGHAHVRLLRSFGNRAATRDSEPQRIL
jgi:hypothetical protein